VRRRVRRPVRAQPPAGLGILGQSADRLRRVLDARPVRGPHGQPVPVSVSVGVAQHHPGEPLAGLH